MYTYTQNSHTTIVTAPLHPGFRVEIARRGATLLSFHTSHEYGDLEVLGGYRSLDALSTGYASRNWIMAPFANRIPDGKYQFEGKEYILPPERRMHGLVAHEDWELLDAIETPE
jgi:aldose 1-epimerase